MPTTTRRQFTAAQRIALQDEALRLRESGYTYDAIAAMLDLASGSNAARAVAKAMARRTAQARTTVDPMTIRFGIEIEVETINCTTAQRALEAAGIACENQGYTHRVMNTWKVVTDGSLLGGCEVVSPILVGEDGLRQINVVMAALRSAGATVNRRCGMHVHLDMGSFDGGQIADLIDSYVTCQDLIDPLVAPSRRAQFGGYCARVSDGLKDRMVAAFKNGQGRDFASNFQRYHTVNVASYVRYGTVEFRQHQGSLNGTKATSWVRFLLALASTAAEQGPATAQSTVGLLDLLRSRMGDNAHAYLVGRAIQAGAR